MSLEKSCTLPQLANLLLRVYKTISRRIEIKRACISCFWEKSCPYCRCREYCPWPFQSRTHVQRL